MRCHPHWVMLAAGSDVESTKSVVGLRHFLYSALPVVVASINIALDKSCRSRQRNLEIFLLYLFGVRGLALGGGGDRLGGCVRPAAPLARSSQAGGTSAA
jgi:hypothetical protein